ncbi:hypothetical protein Trydic_g3530 [Trypoxylus dichotomus]
MVNNTGKLSGLTIFITGASRGIGKAIALKAAKDGANIVIAAKTAEPHPKLSGTIYTAAKEIEEIGGKALPCIVDVRSEEQVKAAIQAAVNKFGGIDILVNNASAISLTGTEDTEMKRYDLMHNINTRGTFLVTKECLPYLKKSKHPHILNISPPLNMNPLWFSNHVAYTMAKYGMSMCVLGMHEEFKSYGIGVNALWPKKMIYTAATEMLSGDLSKRYARKPEIMADAAYAILIQDPKAVTGKFFIDDDVLLKYGGIRNMDKYAIDPVYKDNIIPDFFVGDPSVFADSNNARTTITLLERLSLVDCANREGIETLEAAIEFADQIHQVDTTGVEPLVTVLEDKPLVVREDKVTEGNCREDILSNASSLEKTLFMKSITNNTLVFKNIIDLCEKHGFLKRVADIFKAGPIGALLEENLKREWFHSTIINREFSVFLNNGNFEDTFLYAKDICSNKFPFGIAEILPNQEMINSSSDENPIDFRKKLQNSKMLSCVTFVPSSESTRFFHQLQRQRRTWWRIFSVLPSRYSLSDTRVEGVGHQYVDIHADYPWGSQVIESIKLSTLDYEAIDKIHLQCKVGRNTEPVHYVTNTISTGAMLLNILCDAYEEPDPKGDGRLMFRFHRKLSPYKVSFALPKSRESSTNEDLVQLSLYLCKQLRANNVSSLFLPASLHTLEFQWNHYDQMGIPYNILINQSTLANGVAQLRSRDTTLKEQVHVSELPKYIEQLLKNY